MTSVVAESAIDRIRVHNDRTSAWIVVIDDDPTGAQCVHDVDVVLDPSVADMRRTAVKRRTTFIWTNSRSMSSEEAAAINFELTFRIFAAAERANVRPVIVSRSDSTLRGHFAAEIGAICRAAETIDRPYDCVVFTPAFLEAGRFTSDDVQWVTRRDGSVVSAAATEYARDATFGYRERDLRAWVAARTSLPQDAVGSISIGQLRHDPARAARTLGAMSGSTMAIGNAVIPSDLESLVLVCQGAERAGRRLLHRTGPSFIRALMGQTPHGPLTIGDLEARPVAADAGGLIVVGSHTALTSRQLDVAQRRHALSMVELDVAAVLRDAPATTAEATARLATALRHGACALVTSRQRVERCDPQESLRVACRVSSAVVDVVNRLPSDLPLRYVVAKGGITSHDVAAHALRVRFATVVGQVFPGKVSVLRLGAETAHPGIPYVVFPGNVGDEEALAQVVDLLNGAHSVGPG